MTFTDTQIQSLTFLALGVVVSLATSFLKNINWSRKTKHSVNVLLSALGAVVTSYFQKNGVQDLEDIAKHFTYLYAVSQLFYAYGIRNTQINAWLTKFNVLPAKKV